MWLLFVRLRAAPRSALWLLHSWCPPTTSTACSIVALCIAIIYSCAAAYMAFVDG